MQTKMWTVEAMDFFLQSDQDIVDYYNTHLNATLAEVSQMSGRTVEELKELLMPKLFKTKGGV